MNGMDREDVLEACRELCEPWITDEVLANLAAVQQTVN
jgi:hypothetical protein